jgi:cyclophilin family peptidyl-prolyl cis-trans isomerase
MASPKIAVFTTSMGSFKAELYTDRMPITCGNFIDCKLVMAMGLWWIEAD